jgi:glycosyltransferase involved in cell wall biosynthesis
MVSRGIMPVGKSSGGAEYVAFYLAEHLADRGEEVVLISDVDTSMLERVPAGLSIVEVRTSRGLGRVARLVPMDFPRWVLQHLLGNVRAARRARTVLRADVAGFDVVHAHGALAALLIRRTLSARRSEVPLVYTEHDSTPWSCRYRRWIERTVRRWVYREINLRACRAATAIVANFPSLADELALRAGVPRSRFTTMRNAAEARWLSEGRHPEGGPARHDFDHYYLFVGSLIGRKGPDIMLRALAEVGLPCIFVGDGPMRASLERLASKTGVSGRVLFTGALERREVLRYYLNAEALVLPSVSEGVPLVAMEALGAGTPVVASDLAGIASVVHHGDNGLLVEPGNVASLAGALRVLETEDATRARLRHGAGSCRSAARWSDVADQLHALYGQHRPAGQAVPPAREAMAGLADGPLTADGLAPRSAAEVVAPGPEQLAHA